MSPIERYIDDIEAVRPAPANLPSLFRFRETRIVSEARTVSFNKKFYEVPLGYAGKEIELRYFFVEFNLKYQFCKLPQCYFLCAHEIVSVS